MGKEGESGVTVFGGDDRYSLCCWVCCGCCIGSNEGIGDNPAVEISGR